jgi:PPP family 3-phenylpropionic acid transporter
MFHAVSIGMIHRHFPGTLQGRGQALFSSMTFGAGSALGSLAAGYLWEGLGPASIFYASAVSAALAFLLALTMRLGPHSGRVTR